MTFLDLLKKKEIIKKIKFKNKELMRPQKLKINKCFFKIFHKYLKCKAKRSKKWKNQINKIGP